MPCARTALSMARRGALPTRYGEIDQKNQVPGYATIVTGVLSAVWYITLVSISTNVLADVVVGVGFLVSLYYGFTGIACAIFFRRELHKSIANLLTMGALPVLGAVILFGVFARGMVYYTDRKHVSSQLIWGLGIPDWIVILLIVLGVVLMLVARVKLPDFFRRERRVVAGEPFPTASLEADSA